MKKIFLIFLLFPLFSSAQQYIRTSHGSQIWMVNINGLDSTQLPSYDLSGNTPLPVVSTKLKDSLAALRIQLASIYATSASLPNMGNYSTTAQASVLYSASNHNHTGVYQPVITVLPFANGGISGAVATPATAGAQTVTMSSEIITITPTSATTLNASGGIAGQRVTFVITTSGASSFVITFGTNFKSTATLATGVTTGKIFCVSFLYTGSLWVETGRTTAQ